jgi:hypothetical protein
MGVTGQFEFRKTLWGKLVLRVEKEVKPFWQSKPKRRWRDATPMDLAAPELRHLIDIGRKSRPASLLSPHKEPEPATDLSAPADAVAAQTQLVR